MTATLAICVGLLLGRWWPREVRTEKHGPAVQNDIGPVQTKVSVKAPQPTVSPLLAAEAASARKAPEDLQDFLRELRALQKRGLISFNVMMFEPDKKRHLTNAAKEFLQISEAEAAEIDEAMDMAREKMGVMEAASATVRQEPGSDKVVVSVPSFPEQGGRIYDSVRQGIYSALGPDRGEPLEQLGHLENQMGDFGMRSREIEVTRSVEKNQTIFSFKDSNKLMGQDPASGKWMTMGTNSSGGKIIGRAGVVENFGPLGEKMLPATW